MKTAKKNENVCYCGSNKRYKDCCGRYLDEDEIPANAELLMRSRYTAYVLLREDYLLATWHPSTRPAALKLTKNSPQWIRLKVKNYQSIDTEHATVEFIAYYKIQGKAHPMHEISNFVRENGKWFYVDVHTRTVANALIFP